MFLFRHVCDIIMMPMERCGCDVSDDVTMSVMEVDVFVSCHV